ncbi:dinucleotide-utilizing enzyme [Microbacterium sp. NPDC057407]|uniref:dinucleotide-utilizing enzyme n=1 Tax=Microbacterium sp. NPDC057407 TaxID=3346120 RepID=UPI003672EDEF
MPTRPRLVRSIPFWALVALSLATILTGAALLADKLGAMTTTLNDGTATGVDVYVGQSLAGLGATLLGAGVVGLLLALGIAAVSTLRPHPPAVVVEPVDGSPVEDDAAAAPSAAQEDDAPTLDDRPAEVATAR